LKSFKWFALSVLAAGLSIPAYAAQSNIKTLHSGTQHEAFFGVSFEGNLGYAVGAGGSIYASADKGQSWARQETPSQLSLFGVALKNNRAIAVGQFGLILTKQGDQPWQPADSGTTERLFSVGLNSSGVAVAVGSFGTLLRSSDFGRSWEKVAVKWEGNFEDPSGRLGSFFEPSLYGVQVNEDGRVLACGELLLIITSEDGGQTWDFRNAGGSTDAGVSPTLSGITLRSDNVGYAVGQEGTIYKTVDAGVSWQALPPTTNANLLGVGTQSNGLVIITGMRQMRMSFDDGSKWYSVKGSDISSGWYSGVAFMPGSTAPVVVGNRSRMLQIDFER
jgi:photosystem II stability/assembly factor-like uncharacterized protein